MNNSGLKFRFKLLLLMADFMGNSLTFLAILFMRYRNDLSAISLSWYLFSSFSVWLGLALYFYFKNLYSLEHKPLSSLVFNITKGVAGVALIFLTGTFYLRFISLSRITFTLYFLLLPLSILAFRLIIIAWMNNIRKSGKLLTPSLLVNLVEKPLYIDKYIADNPQQGLRIDKVYNLKNLRLEEISKWVETYKKQNIEPTIILVEGPFQYSQQIIHFCEMEYVNLMVVPDVVGIFTTPYEIGEMDGLPLLRFKKNPISSAGTRIKRLLDIIGSGLGLLTLIPIFLMIAIAIKLDSTGPILFKHKRLGHHGKVIEVYKFRSMFLDAEDRLKLLLKDPVLRAEYESAFKLKDDPRVTRVGSFLRKTSLDELPQLLNVFKGEMTLVGPRPIVPKELTMYGDKANLILRVVPGLTGLWQTSGRSNLSYDDRVQLDMLYIDNWTPMLDLRILWQTIPSVISKKGAC